MIGIFAAVVVLLISLLICLFSRRNRTIPTMSQRLSIPTGLLVKGKETSIPLKDSSVKATIHGYLVGIDATLKYSNESSDPLEVVFRFPVEESFAVVGLEAVIAGRRIKASIREKEEARQMYDDAIASGFSAALAEETSGDIFSISLGNLPPKENAELHLKLAGELPIDAEGGVRFTLPSVLKPRYTPAGSTDPLAKIGGDISQVQQASAPAVFNCSLDVAEAGGVANVTSPTHTISSETRDNHVHVSLSEQGPLDKDLVILVHYNDPHEPKAVVEAGDGEATADSFMGAPAVMLNFFPKFTTKRASCEFIFVVDRSGSMGGSFINSARETLALFLKSIPPGCSFNIIGFGSSYQSLFPESVPYNQDTLDKAVRHVEGIGADLGGTELLGPLQHIYKQPLLLGLPRQVFVLTDGSVSNTHSCIEEVKKNVRHARCFTFGIGSGASTALVRGLARAGNGTAEFIQSGERLQPKVISSLKRALQPSITDLQIDFKVPEGYEVMIAPSKLPTIFNGDKAVIYGIFKSKKSQQSALSGTATLCQTKGDLKHTIPFEIPAPSKDQGTLSMPIVHHLAAKSLIKDWQAGEGLKGLPETRRKEAIIKLSIESSVVSAHTAYIAVDEEQDKPIKGAIKTWDVTAMMAGRESSYSSSYALSAGGGGMMRRSRAAPMAQMQMQQCMAPPPPPAMSYGGPPPPPPPGGAPPRAFLSRSPHTIESARLSSKKGGSPPPPPPPVAPASSSYMGFVSAPKAARGPAPQPQSGLPLPPYSSHTSQTGELSALISLQQAKGNWNLDAALASVLSKSLQHLVGACPVDCKGDMCTVWATVLALVFLEAKHSAKHDEWELVAMKAEFWLQGQTFPAGTDLDSFMAAAKKAV